MHPVQLTKFLLPKKEIDLSKWSVVACDQYTSQPEYWEAVASYVQNAPSTLHLILPEVYLEQDNLKSRVEKIHATMEQYQLDGTLQETDLGAILVERKTASGIRRGVMLAFDLEAYDYTEGSTSLIRPTEKTVVERIPPRLAVREQASLELPHIMLLIDDAKQEIIEPLFAHKSEFSPVYDTELMEHGGHLSGWFVPEGIHTQNLLEKLSTLTNPATFRAKYHTNQPVLAYAVGDGNHSMATAKAAWEKRKLTLSEAEQRHHPARFVLAEVVNIHDASLQIEGIHRVLFHIHPREVFQAADAFFRIHGGMAYCGKPEYAPNSNVQQFPCLFDGEQVNLCIVDSPWTLPVATLQNFLDDFLSQNPKSYIDYIHGADVVRTLVQHPRNMGFLLPDPSKEDLFRGVIEDGVLPRKTFSMGEAHEKRFYFESRSIL